MPTSDAVSHPLPWAVVASRFHESVVDRLVEGALTCLAGHGVPSESVRVVRVPGAWELPQATSAVLARPGCRGVVALGAVVRGETPHFDVIVAETARGLMSLALQSRVALGFGLLTCDDMGQALARAGGDRGNKGFEAAEAAWDLSGVLASLGA